VRCKVDETADFRNIGGSWPVENFLDKSRIWATAIFIDNVGEETDLVRKKIAFVEVENHASFVESTKDGVDVSFVFFWGFAVNEDVVKIDNAEFIDVGP
jgi:hypothetical protein